MAEDRVLGQIKKIINDRQRTDRLMSFDKYFAIIIIIIAAMVILFFASLQSGSPDILLVIIAYIIIIIYYIYMWHKLIKRAEHLKKEQNILSKLIFWFEGKIDGSKINNLRIELKEREKEEQEKPPLLWAILSSIPYLGLIAGLYISFLLTADFYRHDKREASMLRNIHDAMENAGGVFLIPMKPQNQEIPKRDFMLYVILTFLTLGILIIYWIYYYIFTNTNVHILLYFILIFLTLGIFAIYWIFLFKDPNVHFEYQKEWETRLLDSMEIVDHKPSKSSIPSTKSDDIKAESTVIYPEEKTSTVLLKAELILPERKIELKFDADNVFGRSDFENDLSKEQIGYISKKDGEKFHFKIFNKKGTFYIVDKTSANGTKLNDKEIKNGGENEIKNGDKITLAGINDFIIIFKY